jgi:hypothetical protein
VGALDYRGLLFRGNNLGRFFGFLVSIVKLFEVVVGYVEDPFEISL